MGVCGGSEVGVWRRSGVCGVWCVCVCVFPGDLVWFWCGWLVGEWAVGWGSHSEGHGETLIETFTQSLDDAFPDLRCHMYTANEMRLSCQAIIPDP